MHIEFLSLYLDFQLSYHKFNESQREQAVLKRLQDGELVALISDAGTPGISDPGMELVSDNAICESHGPSNVPLFDYTPHEPIVYCLNNI